MAFVDEITLHIKAGNGGNGVVRWRHEKGRDYAGAAGGNAGHGGDVYAHAVRDIGILNRYKTVKLFEAERGLDGMKKGMDGRNGEDLIIDFPIGSTIINLSTNEEFQLLNEGEKILLLKGGKGGLGNEHFKSSVNTTPYNYTLGKKGEEADFKVELRLIVDAGFVGFPNAGKSSLLNTLTNAKAKVANYQFTTLEPNLGDFYGYIVADIPGLIEGASEGKGLGHKFLKHIERTKIIFHCISLENEDVVTAYKTIRAELEAYSEILAEKPEIIILTKTDVSDEKKIAAAKKKLTKYCKTILSVSIIDDVSVKKLRDDLVKILRNS